MKILFTGASSFSGTWIADEMHAAGHEVVATFQKSKSDYSGLSGERVKRVLRHATPVWNCSFGDDVFLEVLQSADIDAVCHHGADVRNYRSMDFDVGGAINSNSHQINRVCDVMVGSGCPAIILTGSVFEGGEGIGSDTGRAFSPYGLSKELTYRVFEYFAELKELKLGKFVIPNPFGPFEEPRFTAYLVRCWLKGEPAVVNTPDYVRDNIHVRLLALAYVQFLQSVLEDDRLISRASPSGYVETQGEFAARFAAEMRKRTGAECVLKLAEQIEFTEPLVRHNEDVVQLPGWSEEAAWDSIAEYYW